jgi:positive phototaxis protein PixI
MKADTTIARLQQLLPQLFQPVDVSGALYLRFQLTPEIPVLLSMDRVQEALLVPANAISPLPNVPDFTIGMMNVRDRVLCVADLGQILGLPAMPVNLQSYQVLVINLLVKGTETIPERDAQPIEKYLGLAVCRVKGVARFAPETLRPLGTGFPECLRPYLMGCFVEADEQVLVLDTAAIVSAPTLFQNQFV